MTYSATTFSLTYTSNGVTYTLNDFDATTGLTFHYGGDGGWGLPSITSLTQRGALQNGDTNIDYRFEPRAISLNLFIEAENYVDHLRIRELLSKVFTVSNTASVLTVTYSSTTAGLTTSYSRSIEVFVRSGLDYGSIDYRDYNVNVTVGLRASNPIWYNTTPISVNVSQAIRGTPTPIPFLIPTTFGGLSLSDTTNITYTGTTIEYPLFTVVVGSTDITGLLIYNASTGKILSFPTLYAGRTYFIDLTYGYKTVTNDLGANAINLLSTSSNLATWALDPTTTNGINTVVISATSANSASLITMTYYLRYIAV